MKKATEWVTLGRERIGQQKDLSQDQKDRGKKGLEDKELPASAKKKSVLYGYKENSFHSEHLKKKFLLRVPCLGVLKALERRGSITGVPHVQIALLYEEIAEGLQLGIPQAASGFGKFFGQAFQELVDFVRSNRVR